MRAAERLACAVPFAACAAEWAPRGAPAWGVFGATALLCAAPGGFAAAAAVAAGAALYAPLAAPNHLVVAGWLAGSLAIGQGRDPPSARALYAAIMGLATAQKLLSPDFVDGSFPSFLALTGGLLRPLWFSEAWASLFLANQAAVEAAPLGAVVVLRGPAGTAWWGLAAAWAVIGVEAALAVLAARGGPWFLGLASAFVVALPVVRDEPVFTSVLAVVTALCTSDPRPRAALYGVASVAAVLSLG